MTSFKVGDRVRFTVVGGMNPISEGEIGIITEADRDGIYQLRVKFPSFSEPAFIQHDEVELISSLSNKVRRYEVGDVVRLVDGYDEWELEYVHYYDDELDGVAFHMVEGGKVYIDQLSESNIVLVRPKVAPLPDVPTYYVNAVGGPQEGDVFASDGDIVIVNDETYAYLSPTGKINGGFLLGDEFMTHSTCPILTDKYERKLLIRNGKIYQEEN